MALRKDKIQALKDSLCLDNVDPATRSALNNLVDNLMDLFGDVALPELGELPGIDAGEFGFPEDAPFDFPTGGGGMPAFDPLGGFEGGPPGGGEPFGGDPGGGGEGDGPQAGQSSEQCLSIFPAKTKTEIPAAAEDTPGEGFVIPVVLTPIDPMEGWHPPLLLPENEDPITVEDYNNCRNKCEEAHFGGTSRAAMERLAELTGIEIEEDEFDEEASLGLMVDCLKKCNEDLSFQENDESESMTVYNISCEKIEKGTTVIVSYDTCLDVGYVLVEACGCD
jgi:hypothetical protein